MNIRTYKTQGQELLKGNQDIKSDNIYYSDKNNINCTNISGFSTEFMEKSPKSAENYGNFQHGVDNSPEKQGLDTYTSAKKLPTIGFSSLSLPNDPDLSQNASKIDDSTYIFELSEENPSVLEQNQAKPDKSADTSSKSETNSQNTEDLAPSDYEKAENQGNEKQKSYVAPSLEQQIDRDYKDFSKIYPNISKSSLLQDDCLRSFAIGKEEQELTKVYKDYCSLVSLIEARVLKESMLRLSVENASVGALSGTKSSADGYFSKEQVQRMSPEEIRRNYNRIRESQQHW